MWPANTHIQFCNTKNTETNQNASNWCHLCREFSINHFHIQNKRKIKLYTNVLESFYRDEKYRMKLVAKSRQFTIKLQPNRT